MDYKISTAALASLFALFIGAIQLLNTDAYAQILENKDTNNHITNSSHFLSNSTSVQNSDGDGLVLLTQKLNNASFGYRVLEGQIQNKGQDAAKSIVVRLTVYDKNKRVIGSEFTYPSLRTLKPDFKSAFKMTAKNDDFKGMEYYQISLEWKKPDGSLGNIQTAKFYTSTTHIKD